MKPFFSKLFGRAAPVKPENTEEQPSRSYDPLDVVSRLHGWKAEDFNPVQRDIDSFPVYEESVSVAVGDAALSEGSTAVATMDDSSAPASAKFNSSYVVPDQLQNWFMSQSFIGYQACALIAQHWLVDKACSMAGEDAIRHGWELNAVGDGELSKKDFDKLRELDIQYKLKPNLAEFDRFKNVFGIRVAIFQVDSDDPKYYEKPFNIDGVTKGSYKGISQVDPYWMTPLMTSASTSDPSNIHFYDPEYWVISGKKYHRSHLIIARGPQPADVLKPTYVFGGIPMTQRIYERVYAAERTANEAPLLALSKRTTSLHVDLEKVAANQGKFEERLRTWVQYRDNHAVKVLGKEEKMEQADTNLSDFDSVIMNQYQLVAAIAKVPATKLLGTSPKGFNATGDFELNSYHEELESIQEHTMAPLIERHYMILCRSLGLTVDVQVAFNPVDSVTMKEQAEINGTKASTAEKYVNMGAVSPDEVRESLRDDKHSGFNRLTDDEAETEPGMNPENLASFQEAGAEEQKGEAALHTSSAKVAQVENKAPEGQGKVGAIQSQPEDDSTDLNTDLAQPVAEKLSAQSLLHPNTAEVIRLLTERLSAIEAVLVPEGSDINHDATPSIDRTVKPSVKGIERGVSGVGSIVGQIDPTKHPKMKLAGLLLSIENPRGTIRQGMDIGGNSWSTKMPHHYGFIKSTNGADGDEVDCFVGKNLTSDKVFVINQLDPSTKDFDEHKCMLGFDSVDEAKEAYHAAYADGWKGFGDIHEMSMSDFKAWVHDPMGCNDPFLSVQKNSLE